MDLVLFSCFLHPEGGNQLRDSVENQKASGYYAHHIDGERIKEQERSSDNSTDRKQEGCETGPQETHRASESHQLKSSEQDQQDSDRIDDYPGYPLRVEEEQQAYDDVNQVCFQEQFRKSGMVRITLLPQAGYDEEVMKTLGSYVDELLERQVPQQDIAILVRSNRYIPQIADYFLQTRPHVTIISDEAFRLDASLAVCTLVSAMQLLIRENDQLARASVEKAYYTIHKAPLGSLLDDARTALLHLPMVDMVEQLYQLLQLSKLNDQGAYLCTFFDKVNDFVADNGTDIEGFLTLWEESIHEKTIPSDNKTGIRIISIHKSKGLEYNYVICPFCDWQLEKQSGNILWCQPDEQPFSDLPIAPIDYSQKQMIGTIYERDYLQEHLQNTVDNLNLLYVAFTRACKGLYVLGKRGAKASRSGLIEQCLPLVAKEMPEAILSGLEDEKGTLQFSLTGDPRASRNSSKSSKSRMREANPFLQPSAPVSVDFHYMESQVNFRQSNRSQAFIGADEQDEIERLNYIQTGSVLHQIFSTIRTTDDIEDALKNLQFEGVLYDEHITPERIMSMLRQRLQDPRVSEWFSPHWTLFNECTILTLEDGKMKERRPDRVMTDGNKWVVVDFKFGSQKPEYLDQVREYMQLIRTMQPEAKVSGYLWLVYSNKIEEVV